MRALALAPSVLLGLLIWLMAPVASAAPCIDVDCTAFDTGCSTASCDPNAPADNCDISTPLPNGTACEDGLFCTSEDGTPGDPDACLAGVCTGVAVDCSGSDDQCNTATCNAGTGVCEADTPRADGTTCDDGQICSSASGLPQTADACLAGVCTGVPVDCSGLDDQCNTGTCNAGTGVCEVDPLPKDFSPCEDGLFCTSVSRVPMTPDICILGTCIGLPVDCSGSDDQCNTATCNVGNGVCEADTPRLDGTTCEDGQVCTSVSGLPLVADACLAGVCTGVAVDCSAVDDQCNTGTCNVGTGACEADTPRLDGTTCDDGQVCTSDAGVPGAPDACLAGVCTGVAVDCSGLDDECNTGTCNAATGVCEVDPLPKDLAPCQDGLFCTSADGAPGGPDICLTGVCTGVVVDCSGSDDQCNTATCNLGTGVCEADTPRPDGTTCEDGQICSSASGLPLAADACLTGVCTGVAVDCSGLDDQCNTGTCNAGTGVCEADPLPDLSPCEDGLFCTSADGAPGAPDACLTGVCTSVAVDCSASDDQCNTATCNAGTGVCEADTPRPDGTTCEDGQVCSSVSGLPLTADACLTGVCTGVAVDCSGLDDQCNTATCNAGTGVCEADTPRPDGTTCEDGQICTSVSGLPLTADACLTGVCTGVAVDCSASDDQCNAGACNLGTGVCEVETFPDLSPCEDGLFCTSADGAPGDPDACLAGVCTGVVVDCSASDDQCNTATCNAGNGVCEANTPRPDGTTCEDGQICTSVSGLPLAADECSAGVCTGVPVDCSGLDDQCNTGTCNVGTGVCQADPLPDLSPCEDGLFCSSADGAPGDPDACLTGVCTGVAVDCSASDNQCNTATCNVGTGVCQADTPRPDGTTCEDGQVCTSVSGVPQTADACLTGVCTGTAVDCSGLGDQCNSGSCNVGTGACEANPFPEFFPCEDGLFCTSDDGTPGDPDACLAGVCTGVAVDCSGLDDQCNTATCNAGTGVCDADTPRPDGTTCDDGQICTSDSGVPLTADGCLAGVCTGVAVDCSGLDDQCNTGTCNLATGGCEVDPLPKDLAPCEDGLFCTSASRLPQTPDICVLGSCTGLAVDCSGSDDQCNTATCNAGNGVCEADTPRPNGTTCEDGQVCTSDDGVPGAPDACLTGVCTGIAVDCSGSDDECNTATCNLGNGVCETDTPRPDGTTCEDGQVCTSVSGLPLTADACLTGVCTGVAVDCSESDDQCNTATCNAGNGVCEADTPRPDGTTCEDGQICTSVSGLSLTADACLTGVCTGVAVDCSGLDDQCNTGACNAGTGVCEADPLPELSPCEDGQICTSASGLPQTADACLTGVCTGVAVDCSGLDDQCNTGTCNAGTGACEADPLPELSPCEDGLFCTSDDGAPGDPDACLAGVCTGIAVDCSASDDQCNIATCNVGNGVCEADTPRPDGTTCEDGQACTSVSGLPLSADACLTGICTGIAVDCTGLDDQCNTGTCNAGNGACEADPLPDLSPCEDGQVCTSVSGLPLTADACLTGVCTGVAVDCSASDDQCNIATCNAGTGVCEADTPRPDGTTCEDGQACTSVSGVPLAADACLTGVCTGVPVDCSGLDDQCNSGSCNAGTGVCGASPLPDFSPCEDGQICTSVSGSPLTPDTCLAGVCTGVAVDCSGLDDQCNTGSCNAGTGVCEADTPRADGTTCEDGQICTSASGVPLTADGCLTGVCTGVAVDCSGLDDQCNTGTCNLATGVCEVDPFAKDFAPCEDGLFCTSVSRLPMTPDICMLGTCIGLAVDCSGSDDQCNTATCNAGNGACEADTPRADGTTCEDGQVCTSVSGLPLAADECSAGVCTGVAVDCSGLDDQCNTGTCNAGTGVCEADPLPDFSPCEDGQVCSSDDGVPGEPDACLTGVCTGVAVDCTDEDMCTADSCDEVSGCINDPIPMCTAPAPIPSISGWSRALLVLLLLAAVTLLPLQRRLRP